MTKRLLTFLTLLTLFFGVGWAAEVTDHLTYLTTGISGNSYSVFTGKTATSSAVYAGRCAGGSNTIQLNNTNPSGVVSTASGGKVKSITVTWGTQNGNGRTIRVYGKNTPYTPSGNNPASAQLYSADANIRGTTLGDLVSGTSTTITVEGDYEYIGFKCTSNNAAYLAAVDIVWEVEDPAAAPVFSPVGGTYTEAQTVTITSATTGATIYYTTDGTNPTTSSSSIANGGTVSISSSCTLKAMAVADGYGNSTVTEAAYVIDPTPADAKTATFNATIDKGTSPLFKDPVSFACSSGVLNNGTEYRLYSGSTTTFSVPDGYKIFKIEFTGNSTGDPVSNLSVATGSTGTYTSGGNNFGTWIGEAESVSFVANGQARANLINVYYTEPESVVNYYLVGTFNEWHQSADYKFTKSGDNYVLNGIDLPDNAEFQINKVVDGNTTWIGGYADGDVYGIHGGHHNDIVLGGNKNFKIEAGAITNFSFTMNNDNPDKLTVSRDAQFFVKGDFNGWNRESMTATDAGWTIEHVISKANQFGFVDEWGYWYGGRDWWINEDHLDTGLEIKPDGNFYMNIDGTDDYTLTVDSTKTTLTVTRIVVVPSDDYVLVTDASTLSAGDRVIIVNSGSAGDAKALSTTQNNNNRGSTAVTITSDLKVSPGTDVQILALEGDSNGWYFNAGSGYLYAAGGTGNNYLRTGNLTAAGDNAKATIAVNGNAVITFQGTATRNVIRYNSSNNLFSCYTATNESPVYLYKKVEVVERATPPVITPASQNVKGGLLEGVMITAAEGATIHYTLDGSEPTVESDEFEGQAFNVTGTGGERKMVRAIAVEANMAPSYPASVTYTFQAPATPTISPEAGTYDEAVTVTISSTDGGTIYYLVDPEEEPINAAAVIEGNQVYTEGETEIILSENGTHKVYAAVNLNGITSWAQATYTIDIPVVTIIPPVFLKDNGDPLTSEDILTEDDVIWIDNYYGEDGIVHYMIDPTIVPTAEELNEIGTEFDYNFGAIYLTAGQHTIYAVVEFEGNLSAVVSVTVNVCELGDWMLVNYEDQLYDDNFEYIIVSSDHTMAAGSYESGQFNGVACANGNVTFDPYYSTATVNSPDVKVFSIEFDEDNNMYMKDANGNYYSPTETSIGQTSSNPMPVNLYYDDQNNFVNIYDAEDNYGLVYNNNNFEVASSSEPSNILVYFRPKPLTLAQLVATGSEYVDYTISDELVGVKCVEQGDDVYLWCKDQGNVSIIKTENPDPENIVDYMVNADFFDGNWDQSNWIALIFRNVTLSDYERIKGYEGKHIKQGTLRGKYYDRYNYAMLMKTTTLETVEGEPYSPNLYCAANFLRENQEGNATGHTADGAPTEDRYFFVNPKVQELCEITFAVWHPETENYFGYFTLAKCEGEINKANIYGAFSVDWSYNADFGDVSDYLNTHAGDVYKFKAIVQVQIKKSSPTPKTVSPQDEDEVRPGGGYIVYPIDFNPEESVITAIKDVVDVTGKTVAVRKYYNLAGIESDKPFDGVNIIVTTYTDGSRSSQKVMK